MTISVNMHMTLVRARERWGDQVFGDSGVVTGLIKRGLAQADITGRVVLTPAGISAIDTVKIDAKTRPSWMSDGDLRDYLQTRGIGNVPGGTQ